ncbi:ATP-dependent helicase [Candidatus Woesearchaeota archaeon]|nr:ATP-dependent helicase [Candidatus Woesearchaeota archaeon]
MENNIVHLEKQYESEEIEQLLIPTVRAWFFNRFKEFSIPQKFGVMEIHKRNNILVSAPTGATKTLTGFLAILNELVDSAEKGILQDKIYCVYISPLKALNQDIYVNLIEPLKQIEEIAGKDLGIRVAVRTGDTTAAEKSKMLKKVPHILITTPESLAIVLSSLRFKEHLKKVDWVIVDEIHSLAENKRGVHLSLSLERLQRLSSHLCRIGLSATISPLEKVAQFLVGHERSCRIVDVQFLKNLDLQVISPVSNLIDCPHALLHKEMYTLIDRLIQEHKTTLIFTNTRSATERVVDHLKTRFPKNYLNNIGAHHGSLSKELRHSLETRLRNGELKVVVSSTSLELGLDIGFIDLVICLGSPKSVARFLQRSGRSGHRLHETVKARIIVMDRDDLVECSVLLKSAIEKKIDILHIPTNCLDVLAQQIYGMALEDVWNEKELFKIVKQSYCYKDLSWPDFQEILSYLAGEFVDLEERYIYAKIWRKDGVIGKRGKMSRVIYMMNIGTIPDESFITVKIGDQVIGKLDESFLERLKPGDVFVLGGDTYQFKFSRGTVAQVIASANRPPTVPSWISELLPLSFDLALEISRFRRLMYEKFNHNKEKQEIIEFIHNYLYVDTNAASAIYEYFKEQYDYCHKIPNDNLILIENYNDERENKIIFHTLFGRRVNDCLSRAVAFIVSRKEHKNIELGINDNGFYLSGNKINAKEALNLLRAGKIDMIMNQAIEHSEAYKRRFRHCAARAMMILRNYMGRQKRVGRQQVSSQILLSALRRLNENFSIIKEAKREVLEDVMDIENTKKIVKLIEESKIKISEINSQLPSPFSFNIALQGYMDVMKIEEKHEFLRRMHELVLERIGQKPVKKYLEPHKIYDEFWKKEAEQKKAYETDEKTQLIEHARVAIQKLKLPRDYLEEIANLVQGDRKSFRPDFIQWLDQLGRKPVPKAISDKLAKYLIKAKEEVKA